jgi:hypothetical protein
MIILALSPHLIRRPTVGAELLLKSSKLVTSRLAICSGGFAISALTILEISEISLKSNRKLFGAVIPNLVPDFLEIGKEV